MRLINNESQPVLAAFTDGGIPKTGLTVSITIYKATDGSDVTPQDNTLVSIGSGIYKYPANKLPQISDNTLVFKIDGSSTLGDSDRYKFGALTFGGYPDDLLSGQNDIESAIGSGNATFDAQVSIATAVAELQGMTTGSGTIVVNHDYGGSDNLRIVDGNNSGIENANIYAYLKSDWDNGLRTSAYCKGWSMTDGDGRWSWSVYLEDGTYYLVVDTPGFEQQSLKEVVVS